MRGLLKLSLIFGILALGILGYRFATFRNSPATSHTTPVTIEIHNGDSLTGIIHKLDTEGFRIDPLMRRLWIKKHGVERKLRIGEFEIQPGWSASKVLNHLFFGTPILRSITIKEGSNLYEIEALLKEKGIASTDPDFQSWVRRADLLKKMGVPDAIPAGAKSLEGFLFPETYTYFKSDKIEKILGAMLSQFQERALPILEKHPLGKTAEGRFQLLTLASVVEKESGNVDEQPVVASVFWNRLNKRMRLESDPTIIYGLLPNFDGNIRRSDIRAPSVWNTYVIHSLPAGPISNPGLSAIRAVVEPAITDYFFFVAKGAGEHVFSKTYAEHSKNVQKYQLKRSSN
jgi:UPF0755 protein